MTLSVEFTHRKRKTPRVSARLTQSTDSGGKAVRFEATSLNSRAKWIRLALMVAASAGLAFFAGRAGYSTGESACFFLGLMPLFWILASLVGLLLSVQKVTSPPVVDMGSDRWPAQIHEDTVEERLQLTLGEQLELRRLSAEPVSERRAAYTRVRMERQSEDEFGLQCKVWLRDVESLVNEEELLIPASAFENQASFDAFCLALQAKIWGVS
jgi:hypothetical protein